MTTLEVTQKTMSTNMEVMTVELKMRKLKGLLIFVQL